MENENFDALQSKNRPPFPLGRYVGPGNTEINHKGKGCHFKVGLLCQEGYCSECAIFREQFINKFKFEN